MRVLVVGGTRFIGLALVDAIHRMGHEVRVFHRGQTSALLPAGVTEMLGDRSDPRALAAAVRAASPDRVVDTVLHTERDALALARASANAVGRLVVLSSMDVYRAWDRFLMVEPGPTDPVPLAEDAPLRRTAFPRRARAAGPDDPRYGYDKLQVERALLRSPELAVTIMRLPFVFGPRDYRERVGQYLTAMDGGRPIQLEPAQAQWRCSRGFVENVAHAIALATCDDRAGAGIYNVGDDPPLTELEWVGAIGRGAGWRGEVQVGQSRRDDRPRQPVDYSQPLSLDTTRLRTTLPYRDRVSLDRSLRLTIAYHRALPRDVA